MEDLKEIKHLRRPREKHFLKEDGSFIAEVYAEDIHYLKNGIYEEIDNTLETKNHQIQNKNNAFTASFEEKSCGKLLTMESDGYTLSMSLKNEKEVCPNINGKEVEYQELLEELDIKYTLLSNKVKEAIIIKENKYDTLEFMIETPLDLVIANNGTIKAKEKDKTIFIIEAPYMVDQKGLENNNIYYELQKHNNHYDIKLKLDKE